MTKSANAKTITISASEITVNKDGSITLPIESATDLIRIVLAARKDGYEARRDARKAVKAKKTTDRVLRLQAQLAELTA